MKYLIETATNLVIAKSKAVIPLSDNGIAFDDVKMAWAIPGAAYWIDSADVADFARSKFRWNGTALVPNPNYTALAPPVELPSLKITAIAADATHAASTVISTNFSEVTCPAGTTLTVSAKLADAAGATIPLTGTFRMPLIASDGRERIVGVSMTNGVASIAVPLTESGVWGVSQASVNRDLPAEQHMAFAGAKVYVTL